MRFPARFIDCSDCQRPFPFSTEDQSLAAELGFEQPRRCLRCRRALESTRGPVARMSFRARFRRADYPATLA